MNILEFIRKNSLLVIIVIAGVGLGLVMMDYSGKASAFSRNYHFNINGTGYSYGEAESMGANGKEFTTSLVVATRKLIDRFDLNGDERFDEQEAAALGAWLQAHPEVDQSNTLLSNIYNAWHYGYCYDDTINIAINRAMIQTAGQALGIRPSEDQIDEYLKNMPAFRQEDGSFNTDLYRRLAGYRHETANRVQEEIFRGVIADIMTWEALESLVSSDVSFNTQAQLALLDALSQSVSGRTAWLPADKAPQPAEPTEDELKAYWEEHKEQYKTPERRIVSVYTLEPGKDSNMENLNNTADEIMQELSLANGQGLDKILADAAENPEYDPFTYKQEDGITHRTYELATLDHLQELLTDTVNYDGEETPLARVAFAEINDAPSVQTYEAARDNGNAEQIITIRQIRGFYTSGDDKLKLVRIEAVDTPSVLPYEEAREMALADLKSVRHAEALNKFAEEVYANMQKAAEEKNLEAAFEVAKEAGAQVEKYGPLEVMSLLTEYPSGVSAADLLGTPSGKLAPLAHLKDGARITSVDRRTVEDTPAISQQKRTHDLPRMNTQLRRNMMYEWLSSAYKVYNLQLSKEVRLRGSN